MPVLERLLVIPHPHIHLDVDFTAEETKLQGTAGISARIGTLLRIGMTGGDSRPAMAFGLFEEEKTASTSRKG